MWSRHALFVAPLYIHNKFEVPKGLNPIALHPLLQERGHLDLCFYLLKYYLFDNKVMCGLSVYPNI